MIGTDNSLTSAFLGSEVSVFDLPTDTIPPAGVEQLLEAGMVHRSSNSSVSEQNAPDHIESADASLTKDLCVIAEGVIGAGLIFFGVMDSNEILKYTLIVGGAGLLGDSLRRLFLPFNALLPF